MSVLFLKVSSLLREREGISYRNTSHYVLRVARCFRG